MKTFTEEELKKIIENHRHWLLEDCDGWEDMRADFTRADLRGANLTGADLRGANLKWANLVGADLRGADLTGAYLRGADFTRADLVGADLRGADFTRADLTRADLTRADLTRAYLTGAYLTGANLEGADLVGANLRGADLRGADLVGADLTRANLEGANLVGADLTRAYLTGAYLTGANLVGANLTGAKNVPYLPMACPDKGAFIGWKKAVIEHGDGYTPVIVKLRVPADAQRSSVPFRRKCRCDKAKVVGVYSISGEKLTDAYVVSMYDHAFVYSVGLMVEADNFCTDKFAECAPGIHFFMNRQEAIECGAF